MTASLEPVEHVHEDGTRQWRLPDGRLHRVDGPAEVGPKRRAWYVEGMLHREDGPAIENATGTRCWFIRNQWHRLDGPAFLDLTGTLEDRWCVRNQRLVDPHDLDVLVTLREDEEWAVLEHTLLLWRRGGPPVAHLAAAVRGAIS